MNGNHEITYAVDFRTGHRQEHGTIENNRECCPFPEYVIDSFPKVWSSLKCYKFAIRR